MGRMNRFLRWLINRGNASRSARLLRRMEPHLSLSAASRTLELGAGVGGLSALVYDRYRPERVVITDFDPQQVETARRSLIRRYGTLPNAFELGTADALAIPFPDATFDAVFAIGVLHHVEERHSEYIRRPRAVAELRRVLVPGGTLVYTEFSHPEELRRSFAELGFTPVIAASRVGHEELDIVRAPVPAPPP